MEFEIGEVVVYVRPGSRHYGEETTILSEQQIFPNVHIVSEGEIKDILGYRISIPASLTSKKSTIAEHRYLRKKKPPTESKDITETREKGAPSYDEIIKQFNVEVCDGR